MAGTRQVTIQFLGDARKFVSETGKATKATDSFGSKLSKIGKAALIGFAGATVAAGKIMYDFADAAVQDQKSAALLANTLKNTTGATDKQVASVEDWISKQEALYGVTDDDLRPALSKLAAATGSIAKSQKLASLAMDVSAGTGKDLASVTMALAKAQTGSLGGLGRMGIATKDAAGHTRTLADVTDELSQKYAGSAAKAADTAAGKFQRLKVDLSETAEAIGYKLLPYADDLGSWLIKDGVPAVEHLAHSFKQELTPTLQDARTWVSDNKDELKDLGKEVVGTVIPAIRDLGGFVGEAVSFFTRLPGPIKSVGVEAGIAAVAIPKLTSAINSVTGSIGTNSVQLGGWRKALLTTAGIAGIGAIEQGARTGNKAVSLLGDSLTGAFIGGSIGSAVPVIGTAIGAMGGAAVGAGIGLFKMHKQADAAGTSSKDAEPKIAGLAQSLNQVTGATTRSTKALILQKLEQDGIVTSAQQLGIATSDLIKASLGNNKAIDRVNAAWEKNQDLLQGIQSEKITSWIYGMRGALDSSKQSIKDANAALDGTDRKAAKAGQSLQQVGKARPQTDKWSALYTGDLNHAVRYTDTSAEDMKGILSGTPGKARANMQPFGSNMLHQLTGIKTNAHTAGVGIGNSIESGVGSGLGDIIHNTVATIQAAINAAHAAAGHGGGGGGGGRHGSGRVVAPTSQRVVNLDDYRRGLGIDPKKAEMAGSDLLDAIVRGIKKGQRNLQTVMQGLQKYVKDKQDQLTQDLQDRQSFVDSFRDSFSQSIFSAQFSDDQGNQVPPTLQKMLDFAKQQQANAKSLAANVQKLLGEGLSKDLIQQLVSQGSSGFDQIGALATGSKADIDQFNQINSDIKSTLEGLGTDLYNELNPSAQSQITLLTQQVASAQAAEEHLKKIADSLDGKDEIHVKGTDLVILLHKLERQTGQKLLVS